MHRLASLLNYPNRTRRKLQALLDNRLPCESSNPMRPDNTQQTSHVEHEKEIQQNALTLRGTLCMPINGVPSTTVLMLAGSGELDRNENGARLQLNIFNEIAHVLAENNIASFRYDKRGCAESDGVYNETGFFDLVDDARACLSAVRNFSETAQSEVLLLGHSEGALIAASLAVTDKGIKGLILLNPFLESLEKTLERQLNNTLAEIDQLEGFKGSVIRMFLRINGDQIKKQRKFMQKVRKSSADSIKIKRTVVNAKWLREHQRIKPEEIYAKVHAPTLSIGGSKDVQCLPQDAHDIVSLIEAPTESQVMEDLTHIARLDSQPASTFRYKELTEQPIARQVPELMIRWINNLMIN